MKPSSLIFATLTMMAMSWLMLTFAYRSQRVSALNPTTANFNVYINDEEGRPVANYAVRLDGRLIGKTNSGGTVSKEDIAIGNTSNITLNIKSVEFHYETPREAILDLPHYVDMDGPDFTITATLCFEFVTCEEDRFTIALSPPSKPKAEQPARNPDLLTAKSYEFNFIRAANQGPKILTVISEIERIQKISKTGKVAGTPIDVLFSHISSDQHGQMLRIIGSNPKSDTAENEFALLLPLKPQLQALAHEVAAYLRDLTPEKNLVSARKSLKLRFQQPLNKSYEVYAGGFSGVPITPDSWNLAVPNSGKFFLTIVKKGQIVARKFYDAGDAAQIDFDEK